MEDRVAIRELVKRLKAVSVDKDSALIISLLVREGSRRERLMAWMEENPQATPVEICRKARALHG